MPIETYLVLDPGETTGWSLFEVATGNPISMGWAAYGPELFDLLAHRLRPTLCYVYEDFRLRTETNFKGKGHYTKQWDPVITCRAIGAIEITAHAFRLPVVKQTPQNMMTAAAAWNIPMKMSDKQLQHPMDAVAHGRYYAWKHLGILPPDNLEPIASAMQKPPETKVTQIGGLGDIRRAMKASKKKAKGLP